MIYDIVTSDDWRELIDQVNDKIKKGWRTVGGVAIDGGERYTQYYQSLVHPKRTTTPDVEG